MPWSQGVGCDLCDPRFPPAILELGPSGRKSGGFSSTSGARRERAQHTRSSALLLQQISSSLSLTPLSKYQEQPLALEKSSAYVSLDQSKAKQNKKAIHNPHFMASAISYDFSIPQNAMMNCLSDPNLHNCAVRSLPNWFALERARSTGSSHHPLMLGKDQDLWAARGIH